MSLLPINLNPTARQLRQFAAVALPAVPTIGYLWTGDLTVTGWCAAAGAVITMAGLAVPATVRWLFLGMTAVTWPVGFVVGEVMLAAVFYCVMTPIALILRLSGRDELQLRSSPKVDSFWQKREAPSSSRRYFRQS